MDNNEKKADQLSLKQKKGTWKRFIKLFPKCRLPWIWLAVYLILDLGLVNIGVSETDYTAQLLAGDTSASLLSKLIGVIIINLIGSNLVILARQITSARTDRNMREVLFNKVSRLPMSYFKDDNPREAIYRIVSNSTVVSSTILYFAFPVVTAGYAAIAVFKKVFTYDWRLSVILLAFIPVQILIAFIFGRLNRFVSVRYASLNSELMQKLAEIIMNIPLAKAFAKEDKEVKNGEELTSRLYKINIKSSWLSQFKDLSETIVSLIQSVIIVFVGVLLLRDQDITTRSWVAFFVFSGVFTNSITELMMYWNNVKNIQGSADRIAEIMVAPEEDRSGEKCENMRGDIKLDNIHFAYEEDKPILGGVSCEFKDNSVTALLGVSGCGKTTLVNLITRLYIPESGDITVAGKSIYDYALDDYRDQFVMVSQNGMLFSGTIRENVCYGNGNVTDDSLIDALKKAGAYDFVMNLENGIDTRLEEYGNNLSGGQRQRLAVARALLSDAHYLILDEPAASMDAIATAELMEILKNISEGRCMIIIAHTAAVLPVATRVVIVEDGRISAEGEIAEVLKTNEFLREFSGKKVSL